MADHNPPDAVSRRNVLKTAGGLLAGSTMLAGLGAGRGAAETEEGLQIEVREFTEEYIAVEVRVPEELADQNDSFDWTGHNFVLGYAERFVIHEEDAVSLPEDTDGFATPVELDPLDPGEAIMYFRTADVDLSEADGEEVMLGLGLFPERTVPEEYWDACPGHRDY